MRKELLTAVGAAAIFGSCASIAVASPNTAGAGSRPSGLHDAGPGTAVEAYYFYEPRFSYPPRPGTWRPWTHRRHVPYADRYGQRLPHWRFGRDGRRATPYGGWFPRWPDPAAPRWTGSYGPYRHGDDGPYLWRWRSW